MVSEDLSPSKHTPPKAAMVDFWLLGALACLLGLGVTMVFSSSIAMAYENFGDSFAYLKRQLIAVALGLVVAYVTFYIPMHFWKKNRGYLLLFGYVLLIAVLLIGTEINGSKRWLPLPFFNFQPSELMKLIAIIFMAGFLIKHQTEVNAKVTAVLRLAVPFALMGLLLLLEPDFGATFVIILVLAIMLFIAGAPKKHFLIILLPSSLLAAVLIQNAQYRLTRVQSFLDPWDDPFGTDYQLIQSLLAHGQGGWTGVGLGESVQKLSYLPEAHTDYIFSIFGEEFGVLGVMLLIALYAFIIFRIFLIGARAIEKGHAFGGLIAYGIGAWIAIQAAINMSVTLGIAPSKGLTLPLFSYGGSSALIFLSALAIVFRVDYESRHLPAIKASETEDSDGIEPSAKTTPSLKKQATEAELAQTTNSKQSTTNDLSDIKSVEGDSVSEADVTELDSAESVKKPFWRRWRTSSNKASKSAGSPKKRYKNRAQVKDEQVPTVRKNRSKRDFR